MKWLSVFWTVLWNAIVIFFVVSIINSLSQTGDSGILAALLIFIYASVVIKISTQGRLNNIMFLRTMMQNAKIIRKVGTEDDIESLEEEIKEDSRNFNRGTIDFYINLLGYGIVCLIAILQIGSQI